MKVYMYYIALGTPYTIEYLDNIVVSKNAIDRFWDMYGHIKDVLSVYHINTDGSTTYLYSYTDDKYSANKFETSHDMSIFIKRKIKMSVSEYEKFKSEAPYALLIRFNIDDTHVLDIPQHESDMAVDFQWLMRTELSEYATFPYMMFAPKYIKALDKLLYCTFYQCVWGDDPDYYDYNYEGYGITAEGYGNGYFESVDMLMAYSYQFELVLRKDDNK